MDCLGVTSCLRFKVRGGEEKGGGDGFEEEGFSKSSNSYYFCFCF